MTTPARAWLFAVLMAVGSVAAAAPFDHTHAAWNGLLKKHVRVTADGSASQVSYAGLATERGSLQAYLASLSAVAEPEFRAWPTAERMAFLINAYNAYTVELILRSYPRLASIRDLGNIVFNSPWKRRFFALLGEASHLDRVEHELLRSPGVYDEPRVHFALNCASVGCPMLREEAYVAARLEAQLEDQARRFLSDRSRNRYDPESRALAVSRIFDWYRSDWERGYRGWQRGSRPVNSLEDYFARYAALLTDDPAQQAAIRGQKVRITFLDYDWTLNDAARSR